MENTGNEIINIKIQGRFSLANMKRYNKLFVDYIESESVKVVNIAVNNADEIGIVGKYFLRYWKEKFLKTDKKFIINLEDKLLLNDYPINVIQKKVNGRRLSLQCIGDHVLNLLLSIYDFLELLWFSFYWSYKELFTKRKGFRRGEFIKQMILIGVNSLPIVGLIALLFGIILGLQSAKQLSQYGANIFLADIIGVSMSREMGPLITAIILAGRSGSSISAEISTMKVTEEIDALKVMGINPVKFIVVPKFWAMTASLPMLTMLADLIGVFGGFLIGFYYLDLSAAAYFNELFRFVTLKDIFAGLIKSVAFAWIITSIGAYYGFSVKGGAEGVGKNTTSSVVASVFWIIVADSFFSLLFYFF